MTSTLDLFHWNPYTNTTTTNYFGCNVDDRATERHVLESVGSYGYQLNRIIDVVELLIANANFEQLTQEDEKRFQQLKAILSKKPSDDQKLKKSEKLNKSEDLKDIFSKQRPADERLKKVEAFVKMAAEADKAADDFTQKRVEDLLDAMRSLKNSDSYMYKVYRQQIANDLGLKDRTSE